MSSMSAHLSPSPTPRTGIRRYFLAEQDPAPQLPSLAGFFFFVAVAPGFASLLSVGLASVAAAGVGEAVAGVAAAGAAAGMAAAGVAGVVAAAGVAGMSVAAAPAAGVGEEAPAAGAFAGGV